MKAARTNGYCPMPKRPLGRCAHGSVLIITVNAERLCDPKRESWLSEFGNEQGRPKPSNPRKRADYALFSYQVCA